MYPPNHLKKYVTRSSKIPTPSDDEYVSHSEDDKPVSTPDSQPDSQENESLLGHKTTHDDDDIQGHTNPATPNVHPSHT